MKKLSITLIILLVLCATAYYILLKKPQMLISEDTIAKQIELFNQSNPDFNFKVPKGNVKIIPVKGSTIPTYEIQINNPEITYSLKAIAKILGYNEDNEKLSKTKVKETADTLTIIYKPTNSHLAFRSIKGFKLKTLIPDETVNYITLNINAKELNTSDIDISSLLNTKNKTAKDIYYEILAKNYNYEIDINNFIANITPENPGNDEIIGFEASFDNLHIDSSNPPDLLKSIYDNITVDYNRFAEKGSTPSVNNASIKNLSYIVKVKDNKKGHFKIKLLQGHSFLGPSSLVDNRLKFKFDYTIQNVSYKHYDEKDVVGLKLESLSKLNKIQLDFSIDKLSPKLLEEYIKFIKEVENNIGSNPNYISQYLMVNFPKIQKIFLESEPIIEFSINPIDHDLVQANTKGKFIITKDSPIKIEGKSVTEIKDMPKVHKKLLSSKLATQEDIDYEMKRIEQYFVNDGNGNYKAVFEITKKAPYIFLNGKPLK